MKVQYRSFQAKRAFGVEGEFSEDYLSCRDMAAILQVKDPSHCVEITEYKLSDGLSWHVKTDSTCGWEVASYKGSGIKDINNISSCLNTIAMHGAVINVDCGLHIHAEVADLNDNDVAKIAAYWIKIEPILFSSVPKYRVDNIYCKSLRRKYLAKLNFSLFREVDFYNLVVKPLNFNGKKDRRVTLNFCNYEKSKHLSEFVKRRTIELRLPEMSSDFDNISNWVKFFLNFIDNVIKLPFPSNVDVFNLSNALDVVGLHSSKDVLILNDNLFGTKEWFLRRILRYSKDNKLCDDAITMLNDMWNPLRKYRFDKRTRELTIS